jgi:glutathione peroxidase
MAEKIYQFEVKTIDGTTTTLEQYKGKVLLIVNVASKCGLTPQYKGLQELYDKYQSQGFEILGFPCNQFLGQEPGTEDSIKEFCSLTYNVSFPMFSKIDVNGKNTHPLYVYLKKELPGILGLKDIKWNFSKFLVGKDGTPLKRFSPQEEPVNIAKDIEAALS